MNRSEVKYYFNKLEKLLTRIHARNEELVECLMDISVESDFDQIREILGYSLSEIEHICSFYLVEIIKNYTDQDQSDVNLLKTKLNDLELVGSNCEYNRLPVFEHKLGSFIAEFKKEASKFVQVISDALDFIRSVKSSLDSEESLNDLVSLFKDKILVCSYNLYLESYRIFRSLNPDLAIEDDRAEFEDKVNRSIKIKDAYILLSCPYCESKLGSEDRTFTGSFCKFCGTEWISYSYQESLASGSEI